MKKAFTFIELLVVIIIVSILVSLLLPIFIKSFNHSKLLLNGIYLAHDDRIGYLAETIGIDNPAYFDYSITNNFSKEWLTYE